jgi:predicted TIM-barrel fold metal-dependent hydrolase
MDNSAMFSILEFANDYDLPILIHNNVSSTFVADHPKYLHELEIVLREFPKVKVVFCHAGISRRIYAPFYKNMVQRLLEEYPALYVDYSWIFFEEIICRNGTPDPEWIKLTEDFNEKILLGSDIV